MVKLAAYLKAPGMWKHWSGKIFQGFRAHLSAVGKSQAWGQALEICKVWATQVAKLILSYVKVSHKGPNSSITLGFLV